ncbi:hypothetical protein [Viridibacillus arvi]|uniref:hypothetical protein n=1 Tax=Viridibacillus arvi TaxID=263475 RepID=UPI0034CEC212
MLALREKGIESKMWQTGGLHSATVVFLENKEYYLIASNLDSEKEEFYVTRYDANVEWVEGNKEVLPTTFEEIIAHFDGRTDVTRTTENQ